MTVRYWTVEEVRVLTAGEGDRERHVITDAGEVTERLSGHGPTPEEALAQLNERRDARVRAWTEPAA